MSRRSTEFEGVRLYVPPLWERHEEWRAVHDEADPLVKPLIKTQARLCHLARELENGKATPANLAWLSMWSKIYQLCDGARGAYLRQTSYTAEIISRSIFETGLHLGAVYEPLEGLGSNSKRKRRGDLASDMSLARERVRHRLEAYAAWCLYGDLDYWRSQGEDRNLRSMFDPTHGHRLVKALGDDRELWEDILGEIEVQSPSEAREGLKQARKNIRANIDRLEGWLRHPRLLPWTKKIEEAIASRGHPPSFFELVEEGQRSLRSRLEAIQIPGAYPVWKRSSKAVHGDTLEQSLRWISSVAGPLAGAGKKEIEPKIKSISDTAQWSAFVLSYIRPTKIGTA